MAVYKSTYCSPLLESVDPRVVAFDTNDKPCVWLKTKINSSNKLITGYSIRLLDAQNNIIFPKNDNVIISPLEELTDLNLGEDINSGLNGTLLHVPFFQAWNDVDSIHSRVSESYNALYYRPVYKADHVLDNPSSDWTYDSSISGWKNTMAWNGMLNGEYTIEGEVVFVVNAAPHNGLYVIDNEGQLLPYEDVDGLQLVQDAGSGYLRLCGTASTDNPRVVALHGDVHNKVYYWNNGWSAEDGARRDLWTDIDGHLYNLDLENGSYKWEITLYQGDVQPTTEDAPVPGVPYMDYDNLSFNWFDMMLTTGTILGSTNKRLQIADALNNGKIPANFGTDPLVLQGRYVQLFDSDNRQIANRAYVRSYDTSFGHVYPDQDAFQYNWVEQAQKVAFFKHANNEEQVLANEQVRLATTENINIYTTGRVECEDQSDAEAALQQGKKVVYYDTAAAMGQNDGDYFEADATKLSYHNVGDDRYWHGYRETEANPRNWPYGDGGHKGTVKVVFYNQEGFPSSLTSSNITAVCTNVSGGSVSLQGTPILSFNDDRTKLTVTTTWVDHTGVNPLVFAITVDFTTTWRYYIDNATVLNDGLGLIVIDGYAVKENDAILVKDQDNSQENGIYLAHAGAGWTRSGTYKNWGSFIGKVFFVREGVENGSTNWESLASAGGNLYNPDSATSGNSPLYFKQEAPILLFGDKVKYGVDLVGNFEVYEAQDLTKYTDQLIIDGTVLVQGQNIYNQWDNKIYTVGSIVEGYSADLIDFNGTVALNDYIVVNAGKEYGKSTIKVIQLYTNGSVTSSVVQITTDLSEAYLLKNTTTKTYISPFVGAQVGMAIKLLNNKYVTLASDSSEVRWLKINSLDDTVWCIEHAALTTPLLSASEVDNSVPYKYELRSYFKASDENPFNCYEAPYLKLKINDSDFIGFSNTESYDVIDLAQEVEYLVNEGTYNVVIPGLTTIDHRQVKFTGIYYQHQQMSWESYQWILIDENGNVAQDTGKRYDKEMSVTFYGLENGKNYAAILYVTDDVNNILTLTIYFKVDFDPTSNLDGMDFTAAFDCSTHSVVLNFGSYGFTAPSVETTAGSFKYVADNYRVSAVEWDNSYTIVGGELDVFDTINRDVFANPYPLPLFDIYEDIGSIPYTGLSASVRNGINYSHLFANGVLEVPVDSDLIETELELPDGNNQFYAETKIQLTENYCGKFFSLEVENNAGVSASIEFGVEDNFIQDTSTISNLLSARNRAYIKIRSNENISADWLYNGSSYFENFSLNNINQKFILQNPYELGDLNPEFEYHALEYVVEGESPNEKYVYMWYKRQKADDKVYYENSPFDLGNLCLVKDSHTPGPIYWSENRGEIYYLTSDTAPTGTFSNNCREQNSESIPGINLTVNKPELGKNITDEDYMPKWPSEEDEENNDLYWVENTESSQYQPVFWDDVVADPNNSGIDSKRLTRYVVRPRHPETQLSQKPWVIVLKCFDLTTFINSVGSLTFAGDTDNEYTTHVSANGNVVLDIIFIPVQSTEGGN